MRNLSLYWTCKKSNLEMIELPSINNIRQLIQVFFLPLEIQLSPFCLKDSRHKQKANNFRDLMLLIDKEIFNRLTNMARQLGREIYLFTNFFSDFFHIFLQVIRREVQSFICKIVHDIFSVQNNNLSSRLPDRFGNFSGHGLVPQAVVH